MVETVNICDSIKKRYIRLSKGQRKVAQFVVDNPNIIASQIASEVGRLAGVSESTVIRFCYAMDLSGFSELQEKMKAYLIESGEIPVVRQRVSKKKQTESASIAKVIEDVTTSITAIDESVFEETVQAIYNSQAVYVIGFRQAIPAALGFYNELTASRDNVYCIQHDAEDIARNLATMDENSILLTFMFDEEFEDVETVMAIAQRKNVKIFVLCNHTYATKKGIVQLSTEQLCTKDIPSKIALFSMLYKLTELITKQAKEMSRKDTLKYKVRTNV
ncbi:MAG: MurR/RpiR family transcriptional regulator [Solibacillus sp.]